MNKNILIAFFVIGLVAITTIFVLLASVNAFRMSFKKDTIEGAHHMIAIGSKAACYKSIPHTIQIGIGAQAEKVGEIVFMVNGKRFVYDANRGEQETFRIWMQSLLKEIGYSENSPPFSCPFYCCPWGDTVSGSNLIQTLKK